MRTAINHQDWLSHFDNRLRVYEVNTSIFSEGDSHNGVYYILEGIIKMSREDLHENKLVWFAQPEEFIGLTSFYEKTGNYTFTAIAYDVAAKIIHIPADEFNYLMCESIEFKKKVIIDLCDRINSTENRIINFKGHGTKERFIDTIVELVEKKKLDTKPKQISEINVDCSLTEISALAGTSEDNLKRIIHQFHKLGVVTLINKKLVVTNIEKLKKMKKEK